MSPLSPLSPGEVLLRERQREYKVAALDAKRRGDLETATIYYRVAKVRHRGPGVPPASILTQIPPFCGKTPLPDPHGAAPGSGFLSQFNFDPNLPLFAVKHHQITEVRHRGLGVPPGSIWTQIPPFCGKTTLPNH